ncbi:MAG TPA: hypothetical protein VHJ20_22925 [Polyangia bacterium]|nr:hypothetical protein [Polyangia bacterium]
MTKLGRRSLALTLGFGLVGAGVGTAIAAGPVQVFGNWARGDMGNAHNTGGTQYIGCWVNSDPSGAPLAYCEANDGGGSMNFCYTSNGNLVSLMSSMQASSEIQFGWDTSHACTWLTILNFSQPPGRHN